MIDRRTPKEAQISLTARWIYRHGLPLLLYMLLALVLIWPLAINISRAVPGNGYDSWQNLWNMWWLKQALLHGYNPYFTPMLYYPSGASLLIHTLNPINFLLTLPIQALFGLVIAYNAVVLISLTASGYTAYLLAVDVIHNRRAALVAGTIYAFSGYLLAQVFGGHTHMMAAEWLPLAVLALRRVHARPGIATIGLAGLALAINQLCDWQYFVFILIWSGWYALALGWKQRSLRPMLPIGLAIAVALALVSPLAIATARQSAITPRIDPAELQAFRVEHSIDVADLLIPSQLHPLWGTLAEQAQTYKETTHIQNKTAYLGVITLLLGGIALVRRQGGFWLASAIVFIMLSLGPQLRFFGTITEIPLPAALLYHLPFINISRYPVRFIVLAMLSLAILAALGTRIILDALARRTSRPQLARTALAALIAAIVMDNLSLPFPMVGIHVPSIYAQLAQDREPYGVLEAPFYYQSSTIYMLYQAIHNKPLVGGYISRQERYPLLDQIPMIQELAYARPVQDIVAQDSAEIAASVLSYFNIRYLILHSEGGALRYHDMQRIAEAAAAYVSPLSQKSSVIASDARGASTLIRRWGIVETQPTTGSVLTYTVATPRDPLPFVGIGAGWSKVQLQADEQPVRELRGPGELFLYSAQPRSLQLELRFSSAQSSQLRITVGDGDSRSYAVQPGAQQLLVPLDLPAGATRLTLDPGPNGPLAVTQVDLRRR
jgi:hypothetical protein